MAIPLWVRRMASAMVGLMSITRSLGHRSTLSPSGTVLVTTSADRTLPFRVSMALPDRMPWVTRARTDLAPFSLSTAAALTRVPQVSAMSSVVWSEHFIFLAAKWNLHTNQNGDLVFDVTDKNLQFLSVVVSSFSLIVRPHHTANNIGPGALLVDQGERSVKVIGNGCRTAGMSANAACLEAGQGTHRLAPPASGETMTQSSALKFSRM